MNFIEIIKKNMEAEQNIVNVKMRDLQVKTENEKQKSEISAENTASSAIILTNKTFADYANENIRAVSHRIKPVDIYRNDYLVWCEENKVTYILPKNVFYNNLNNELNQIFNGDNK